MTRSNRGRRGAGSAAAVAPDACSRTERIAVFQKTKMCKFHIMGVCTQGDACRFAHERGQLQSVPDLSCTKLCKTLIATGVCNNPDCRYAHNREELRAMPDESARAPPSSVAGATGRQTLSLQEAAPAPPGPVVGSVPQPVQVVGAAPCGLLIGQSMPQGAGPGPFRLVAGQPMPQGAMPMPAGQPMPQGAFGAPVMQAALLQIVQASQAHAAEAARLQQMAEGLQQGGAAPFAAAGPQAAPGGMAYTAPPGQPWPRAGGGAAEAVPGGVAVPCGMAYAAPPGQPWPRAAPARAGAPGTCARQESDRTESTAAYSDAFEDAGGDAADEGGGPSARAGGAPPRRGLGASRVTVKNTFLERVDSQDFVSDSAPGAHSLRAVQTASGRLDLMAHSLD